MENQLTRAIVLPEHTARADQCLQRLLDNCLARCAVLLDRSGQLVTARGDGYRESLVVLGALVAGSFASAREIARLLGEEQFQSLFQQGQRQHILTTAVDRQWLLAVVFGNKSELGMVRLLSSQAASELQQILRDVNRQPSLKERSLGSGFRRSASVAIDALFTEPPETPAGNE